jgi:hypothetical protein
MLGDGDSREVVVRKVIQTAVKSPKNLTTAESPEN